MTTKYSKKSRGLEKDSAPARRRFLALTLLPLLIGALLILATALGLSVGWSLSLPVQVVTGVILVLTSFGLSNVVQKQWNLAAGWLLVGLAIIVWFNGTSWWLHGAAYLIGGAGLFFLSKEFLQRVQQQQKKAGKK